MCTFRKHNDYVETYIKVHLTNNNRNVSRRFTQIVYNKKMFFRFSIDCLICMEIRT